jgi:hypothetical protein
MQNNIETCLVGWNRDNLIVFSLVVFGRLYGHPGDHTPLSQDERSRPMLKAPLADAVPASPLNRPVSS